MPLKFSPLTTQLKAANQLPIETRGTVNLPVQIADKVFDHIFHVLIQSESDCLIVPLFSKKKLLICNSVSVPLYYKTFEIPDDRVFRVVSQNTKSTPSGHSVVVPAFFPDWKRPPIELAAAFEPNERFNGAMALTAPDMFFNLTEDMIPVVIENSVDEPVIVYKDTTLNTSEIVSKEHKQNVGKNRPEKGDKQETKFDKKGK